MAPKRKYNVAKVGDRFGKLTVIEHVSIKNKGLGVLLLCDCGERVGPKMMCNLVGSRQQRGCRKCGGQARGQRLRMKSDVPAKTRVFHLYKHQAIRRGFSWELTKSEFYQLADKPCIYCGSQKQNIHRPSKQQQQWATPFFYTGVDRINSLNGYTVENCQPCCWICNRAKGNLDDETFNEWILKVVEFNSAKN